MALAIEHIDHIKKHRREREEEQKHHLQPKHPFALASPLGLDVEKIEMSAAGKRSNEISHIHQR
jgi:hypothetical protein